LQAREFHSRVSPKGQITLPAEIRRKLDIKPKDVVVIDFEKQAVRIRRKARIQDFYQSVPALDPPRTWEEVEEIVEEEIAQDAAGVEEMIEEEIAQDAAGKDLQ